VIWDEQKWRNGGTGEGEKSIFFAWKDDEKHRTVELTTTLDKMPPGEGTEWKRKRGRLSCLLPWCRFRFGKMPGLLNYCTWTFSPVFNRGGRRGKYGWY
jgi:hypothetical protein